MNNSFVFTIDSQSEGLDLITNGIGELEMNDNSEGLLSSSLEAEQR